jgi:CheY-like chemotaxis protein
MSEHEQANIFMVDDHPAKLLSYETILSELDENLIWASSAREALEHLLKRTLPSSWCVQTTSEFPLRQLGVEPAENEAHSRCIGAISARWKLLSYWIYWPNNVNHLNSELV